MSEQSSGCLRIFGIGVEVGGSSEVAELVRGHIDTKIALEGLDDLIGQGVLALRGPLSGDKEVAIRVGIEVRQNMPPVPAQPARDMLGDFGGELLSGLHLRFGDME